MKVATSSGTVRGQLRDEVAAFLGIPFAQADRFAAPRPVESWTGVRDALACGPAAPQANFGPPPMPVWSEGTCDENSCLTINVWSSNPDSGPKPVLFWIHGGAWLTGGGSLPCYQGEELARAGGIVVVTANYRLSALGFLYVDGGNFGLLDLVTALRWTYDNIAAFGGDPNLITVGGQSAGGHAALCLMSNPETRPLFRRALMQSSLPPSFDSISADPQEALESRRRFEDLLGEDIRTASWRRMVDVAASMRPAGTITPPFLPVRGQYPLLADPLTVDHSDFDILIGWAKDEGTMFGQPRGSSQPAEEGAVALATRQAAAGHPAFVYRFDWEAPPPWYSTHCVDLPFLFGNDAAWAMSPIVAGSTTAERQPVVNAYQAAISHFVRYGNPGHDWTPYTPDNPFIHHFK
ncbi:MAG: carboxylesterase/lipase family protein [Pseudonocardiales bacterium]|nr:carboxylesterase/lipase family protein [Pseudonocardiales bacterium]